MQNGIELPDFLKAELSKLPRNGDRRMLAQIITQLIFPVSHRSLEVWPLTWRRVSKKAVASTEEALRHAWRMYDAAATRTASPQAVDCHSRGAWPPTPPNRSYGRRRPS